MMRIDKWLWVVRAFKTRSQATVACRSGKVLIAGRMVKPSHNITLEDVIEVKQPPIIRRFRVKGIAAKRVPAKLVPELMEDLTSPEEWERLRLFRHDPLSVIIGLRDKGSGRPTKRERRQLDQIQKKESV